MTTERTLEKVIAKLSKLPHTSWKEFGKRPSDRYDEEGRHGFKTTVNNYHYTVACETKREDYYCPIFGDYQYTSYSSTYSLCVKDMTNITVLEEYDEKAEDLYDTIYGKVTDEEDKAKERAAKLAGKKLKSAKKRFEKDIEGL